MARNRTHKKTLNNEKSLEPTENISTFTISLPLCSQYFYFYFRWLCSLCCCVVVLCSSFVTSAGELLKCGIMETHNRFETSVHCLFTRDVFLVAVEVAFQVVLVMVMVVLVMVYRINMKKKTKPATVINSWNTILFGITTALFSPIRRYIIVVVDVLFASKTKIYCLC